MEELFSLLLRLCLLIGSIVMFWMSVYKFNHGQTLDAIWYMAFSISLELTLHREGVKRDK